MEPLDFGFEKCKGGLIPRLNENAKSDGNIEPDVVSRRLDILLPDSSNQSKIGCSSVDREDCSEGNADLQYYIPCLHDIENNTTLIMTAADISNTTIRQIDVVLDDNLSPFLLQDRESQIDGSRGLHTQK